MYERLTHIGRKVIPSKIFATIQPLYHATMACAAALIYRFPSRKIIVVGVTGTKGKSSTVELTSAILEEAGYKTALTNTIRFKIGHESTDNLYKMSMPGRFFMQRFLRQAVKAGCQYAVLEMTSQGVLQSRHKFINLDALIFTNLAPEHIESHGSYENYRDAKLAIAQQLEKSTKKRKIIVANTDDKEGQRFLNVNVSEKYPFYLKDAEPFTLNKDSIEFTLGNEKIHSPLSGEFNLYNILGAVTYTKTQNIGAPTIKVALEKFNGIRGRLEKIEDGQNFTVVVDYAHTPDSLKKVYEVFQDTKRICVLGNTGGGRDKWKRKDMAEIAEKHCDHIILTNEDPYDEDPRQIVEDMKIHIKERPCEIIMDRREAIATALSRAKIGDTVIITGKGTDPYIMGPNDTKIPWSDAEVTKEELKKIIK